MRTCACSRTVQTVAGVGVGAVGIVLLGIGAWARRDVARALDRERIVLPLAEGAAPSPVRSAGAARAVAELIRQRTLESSGGRTYAETDPYLAADGTTSEESSALTDERTGQPLANPDYELWIRSTTLQTALVQAYLAFRLADLSALLGGALVAAGAGITSARR